LKGLGSSNVTIFIRSSQLLRNFDEMIRSQLENFYTTLNGIDIHKQAELSKITKDNRGSGNGKLTIELENGEVFFCLEYLS